MKRISFQFDTAYTSDFDSLIVPVLADGQLPQACAFLDSDAELTNLVKNLNDSADFTGASGKTLMVMQPSSVPVKRLLLVGFGKAEKITAKSYLEAVKSAAVALENTGAVKTLNACVLVKPADRNSDWAVRHNAQLFQQNCYDYAHASRGKHPTKEPKLGSMAFTVEATPTATFAAHVLRSGDTRRAVAMRGHDLVANVYEDRS